jgi:hypothetical protein
MSTRNNGQSSKNYKVMHAGKKQKLEDQESKLKSPDLKRTHSSKEKKASKLNKQNSASNAFGIIS